MKQNITESEVLKLSDAQVIKLIRLVFNDKENQQIEYRINQYIIFKLGSKLLSVKLTIGKMIEILESECYSWELYKQEVYGDTLVICINKENRKIGFREALCDALWEAVKTILNDEV